MLRKAYAGSLVPRSPTNHPAIAPYGAHRTRDGQVIFGIQNEREWAVFCDKVMGQPGMRTDLRFNSTNNRRDNRVELTRLIEERFAPMTSLEVAQLLDDNAIANGRLNDAQDVWDHPQLAARDRWREVQTAHGPYRGLLPPFTFTDVEMGMGPVPAIGEHTDAVLAELGYDADAIAAMHASGAV
jgi:crotonobetainyl-CoA:carnitine CoA-transferase CaiB-like acyl-CoA transferase